MVKCTEETRTNVGAYETKVRGSQLPQLRNNREVTNNLCIEKYNEYA